MYDCEKPQPQPLTTFIIKLVLVVVMVVGIVGFSCLEMLEQPQKAILQQSNGEKTCH